MRIYGNRVLKTLSGNETRPTTSKVREALFYIWQDKIVDCKWLDLCAGNGLMGAEALCRGAKLAIAIEKSNTACNIIRENWQKIANSTQEFKVLRGDLRLRMKSLKGEKFDLIYFDPPYDSNLYLVTLNLIIEYQLLAENGEIAVEYNPKKNLDLNIPNLEMIQTKNYGYTALNFYQLTIKNN